MGRPLQSSANQLKNGFTIVELLVVIAIIGILAAVTVIAFNGVAKRAVTAKVQSDAKNAQTALELHKAEYGTYPSNNDCTNTSQDDICLTASSGNEITYIKGTDGQTYQLAITNTDSQKPTYYLATESETVGVMLTWKQISAGSNHTCAIGDDNLAYCWGDNTYGQLGDNTNTDKLIPTKVQSEAGDFIPVKSISAGKDYTCAITLSNRRAYCWGNNNYGKLGDGTTTPKKIPFAVYVGGSIFQTVKSIVAGSDHTCAITESGSKAYCWGNNSSGQLGNNSNTPSSSPVYVKTSSGSQFQPVNKVAVGDSHTCAIGADNKAYCWGESDNGRLGIGVKQVRTCVTLFGKTTCTPYIDDPLNNPPDDAKTPTQVKDGDYSNGIYQDIVAGQDYSCAVGFNKTSYCWGSNTSAQLGNVYDGFYALSPKATQIGYQTTNSSSTNIYSGSRSQHVCTKSTTGRPFCWGSNDNGQLGSKWLVSVFGYSFSIPVSVAPTPVNKDITNEAAINLDDKRVSELSVGEKHTCAIDLTGWAYCWGNNQSGQIGNGLISNSIEYPTRVRLLKSSN